MSFGVLCSARISSGATCRRVDPSVSLFVLLLFSVFVLWVLAADFVIPVLRLSYNSILKLLCTFWLIVS